MSKKLEKEIFKTENSLYDIRSKYCTDPVLSERFTADVLMVTGFEVDAEGYIVDAEEDPVEPEYVQCKGRVLRMTNAGILHSTDVIFDPYNNIVIMEELFKHYLAMHHSEVSTTQIHALNHTGGPRVDLLGYMTILYSNGATIKTANHYKDTTKYLDAFMRLESMVDDVVVERLRPYDEYEDAFFKKYKTMNPIIAAGLVK